MPHFEGCRFHGVGYQGCREDVFEYFRFIADRDLQTLDRENSRVERLPTYLMIHMDRVVSDEKGYELKQMVREFCPTSAHNVDFPRFSSV